MFHVCLVQSVSNTSFLSKNVSLPHFLHHHWSTNEGVYYHKKSFQECISHATRFRSNYSLPVFQPRYLSIKLLHSGNISNASIELKTDEDFVRFNIGNPTVKGRPGKKVKKAAKKVKMSRKAKLNELKFFRLKAKKKMKSPNPEVQIRYKLEKVSENLQLFILLMAFLLDSSFILLVY